jgi:hypothetical protein
MRRTEMKVFTSSDEGPSSWEKKVNYVDAYNKFVGFDMDSYCCEYFGHGVYHSTGSCPSINKCGDEATGVDLEPYRFADALPVSGILDMKEYHDDGGGSLGFRIVAEGLPDLWVVIWNHHNGYYSHGFTSWNDSGEL